MSLKRVELAKAIELKNYTTIKIGGRARFFFFVNTIEQLRKALVESGSSWYILGRGSKLLIKDSLISRPVIKLAEGFNYIEPKRDCLEVGAATSLSSLIQYCLKHNLSGLENLAGIPATIGGLVAMNASAYGGDISSRVSEVCFVDAQGNIKNLKRQDISFGYRSSSLKNAIIIWIRFNLSESGNLKSKVKSFIQQRLASQDLDFPSCGCVFKNPKDRAASFIIDSCGLKGLEQRGAQISLKHANFIVNRGKASYEDVDYLIQKIKSKVYKKYSIILEEEIKRWI